GVCSAAEPVRLDDVDRACAVAAEETLHVALGAYGLGPERRARAVAREPVEREQPRRDRPDLAVARLEAANRVVLADVPQRVLPFARIRGRSLSHGSDRS